MLGSRSGWFGNLSRVDRELPKQVGDRSEKSNGRDLFARAGPLTHMEDVMRQPHVDDLVRLTQDVPELQLKQGDIGVVGSTWFSPNETYEVEFGPGLDGHTRALLLAEQLQVEDALVNSGALQV